MRGSIKCPRSPANGATRRRMLLAAASIVVLACGSDPGRAQDGDADPARPAAAASPEATVAKKARPKARAKRVETAPAKESNEHQVVAEPVKHICLIDRVAVDRQAKINVASNQRLADLRGNVQAEIDAVRQSLGRQIELVDGEIAKQPQDATLKQKRQALDEQARNVALQANLRSRQLEATRQVVNSKLQSATAPIVQATEKARACGLLITRDVVVDGGDAIDITSQVVDAMNAELQYRPFDLVVLTPPAK